MSAGRRRLALCALCVAGLLSWSVAASETSTASGAASPPTIAGEPPISLASPFGSLPVPTPVQLHLDEESRTKFHGLTREAAVELAKKAFHVEQVAWTPPGSNPGSRLGRYFGRDAVVERLFDGQKVVVGSSVPLEMPTGSGLAPTSLTLKSDGEAFVPENPVVPVAISKQASGGVAFPGGLSVAPAATDTGEAPVVVGNRVIFANVARDTDMLAEPRPGGAELSWQLRSQESPSDEALTFSLPEGASLQASQALPGAVEVVREGAQLMLIPPATATGADGNEVPVSYTVRGTTLTTHVDLGGNVDFPVLVDPLFIGNYGASNGSGSWSGWTRNFPACGCFSFYAEPHFLMTGVNPGAPFGEYGEWYAAAPGPHGLPGSAGITRVDLTGVGHNHKEQSRFIGRISESNGPEPSWTFNGTLGNQGIGEFIEEGFMSGAAMAFCAQQGGGHDGNVPPLPQLCDEENDQGSIYELYDQITGAQNVFNYSQIEGAKITYRDVHAPNSVVLHAPGYAGEWLKIAPTSWTVTASDEGLGIAEVQVQAPLGAEPGAEESFGCAGAPGAHEASGFTGCPSSITTASLNLSGIEKTGQLHLSPVAVDAAGNATHGGAITLNLDQTAPMLETATGSLAEASGKIIGSGNYTLNYGATDGSSSAPQSGVRTLEIKVDGQKAATTSTSCPKPTGTPAEGCYSLHGTWTMSGQSYGAGPHTVSVTAKDWDSNESTASFSVTVNEAAYQTVGPGGVNLETGDFKLNPTDVELSGGNANLSVSRTYDSSKLSQGATGPLGPQWMLSLPDSAAASEWQSLVLLANSSVDVTDAHGNQSIFAPSETGYSSPAGYQADTLSKASGSEYRITDANGNYTAFTQSEAGAPFFPSSAAEATAAGGLNKVTYKFTKTSEGIIEPTQLLGPEPSSGACTAKLVQGCRALTFTYATSKTTSGEDESQWGQYIGRLTKVSFTAWDPAKSEMTTTPVAEYAYDSKGRLRAEWDPRVETSSDCGKACPSLKTLYGYDSEGHVTAVSDPGRQPSLLHYGTIPSDSSNGRLLSASQFNAETAFWNGEALKNTTAPLVSGSANVGATLSVSNGSWSSTVAYSYQWDSCNVTGGECAAIPGATNQTYTPVLSDLGHRISAQVSGTNASGSVTVVTSTTGVITDVPVSTSSFGSSGTGAGQLKEPTGVAVAPTSNVWVADGANHRLSEFSSSGTFIQDVGWGVTDGKEELETCTASCKAGLPGLGTGQLSDPEGIAIAGSKIYVSDAADDRITEYNTEGKLIVSWGHFGTEPGALWEPRGLAVSSLGYVYVADTNNCRVDIFSETGAYLGSDGECGTGVGQFEGTLGVAISPSGREMFVTDVEGDRVQEYASPPGAWTNSFGSAGSEPGKFNFAWAIATDPLNGYLLASSYADGRIEVFTPKGEFVEQFGTFGSAKEDMEFPSGVAVTSNDTFYIADEGNNRIDVWTQSLLLKEPAQPAPNPSKTAVTTIDYQVPLKGSGVPQMTEAELAKWGQTKDLPAEATAIFPPDEPQSWPANDYKRASIYYLDSANRTVNTASPSGAITTAEYNNTNDNPERTLTADNREAALKEGAKSAEVAKTLSTESTYSTDGTELLSSLGPQHQVTLANGTVVSARKHSSYSYDEGAPGTGGPYRLVTKTTEGAQTSEGEKDVRTVKTGYSRQENLGWKLHSPTSTETSTGSQTLTATAVYEPSTGEMTETTKPTATSKVIEYAALPAGSQPFGITSGPDGNVWFTDSGTGKLGKISTSGTVHEYAAENNTPVGITSGPDGNLWFVENALRHVSHMTPSGTLTSFTLTRTSTSNVGITTGPDGNLWFTEYVAGYVGKISAKNELLGEYALPTGAKPSGITAGPDGNLWVAETGISKIAKITPAGTITQYALAAGSEPCYIAAGPDGNLWFTSKGTNKIGKITTTGTISEYALPAGSKPKGIASGPEGSLWFTDAGTSKIGRITTSGAPTEYPLPAGSEPSLITAGPDGSMWFTDYGTNKIGKIAPGPIGNEGARTTQTIYYTTAANSSYPNCGGHPEWAGLSCQGQLAAQPGTSGLPNIPTTTYTYNIWDEPLVTTDTVGATKRTTTTKYDAEGRVESTAITASESTDKPLPTVTDEYSPLTGATVKQSTTIEGKSESVSSTENSLGQQTGYTDATGAFTRYEYESERDGRLTKVNDGEGTAAASTQSYGYDTTTGELTSLKDSVAGTFQGSYDSEGNLTTEGYPNGMNANTSYNPVGEPVSLEYVKTTHCTSSCTWYADTTTPSIHGQWLTQTSTTSTGTLKESDAYDELGRLTEVQDTPPGEGCTTRLYAYDEDGNRTNSTTSKPGGEGKCATEVGSNQPNRYDTADRLLGAGVSYEAFGNTTNLPAADAGGSPLTSSYYVDDVLASQKQGEETISYGLDPVGRIREAIVTGTTSSTTTYHYSAPSTAPAWTITATGAWSRNITGIDGGLAATQASGKSPELQLTNLHGDIIATAALSETESKFLPAKEATEYGAPRTSITSKYAWNGAAAEPTELPTGVINMGARAYIPQLGRFEQTDPRPGGSVNSYAYTTDDPVNEADPSGEWTYNYENFGLGEAQPGTPESWIVPGAIMPPPADLQAEEAFAAGLQTEASSTYSYFFMGGSGMASASRAIGCNAVRMECEAVAHGLAASNLPVAARLRASTCIVHFKGSPDLTCATVLANARTQYARGIKGGCSYSLQALGSYLGGLTPLDFAGGLIGDEIGRQAGKLVCE
jgi:RHS repeat-associated protein